MSDNTAKKPADKPGAGPEKDEKAAVSEYLQAPKKKRRNFVVFALSPNFDPDMASAMSRFIQKNYAKMSIAHPKNHEEFVRQFSRNIVLVIADDQYQGLENCLDLIFLLKTKKADAAIPVLFLTKDVKKLVDSYHEKLAPFHEMDDYVFLPENSTPVLLSKIKNTLDASNQRRSRRQKIQIPITFSTITQPNEVLEGQIIDISMHGALLASPPGKVFRIKDQLLVTIRAGDYVPDPNSDLLKLSARVQRVLIVGNRAGISWEFMSDAKNVRLINLIRHFVDRTVKKSGQAMRAKYAAIPLVLSRR